MGSIFSPMNHISVSSLMDGTPHFASNTCASTSWGKEQISTIEVEEDNATLMEAGYTEVDIIDPLVNGQSCEEFNNYVTPNANVTQQQPWPVVQSPNQSCQPVVDVNITLAFQTVRNFASK